MDFDQVTVNGVNSNTLPEFHWDKPLFFFAFLSQIGYNDRIQQIERMRMNPVMIFPVTYDQNPSGHPDIRLAFPFVRGISSASLLPAHNRPAVRKGVSPISQADRPTCLFFAKAGRFPDPVKFYRKEQHDAY